MAQRSARARVKLGKITSPSGAPSSSVQQQQQLQQHARRGNARPGPGGLMTPSASSASGSSRNSLQLQSSPKIGKSSLRRFLDSGGEKIRERLASGAKKGGYGLGLGLAGALMEEKIIVKRWEGGGRRGELWDNGLKGKKDLELWFPDGDTIVYLTERPGPSNPQDLYKPPLPQPSFRLKSSVLRATESPFLIAALEEYYRNRPITPPPPAERTGSGGSLHGMDYEYSEASGRASRNASKNEDEGVLHRLYFPAPHSGDKIATLRHHLTTRNFFAILFNKALVGMTLGQTLLDLVERTDLYLSPPNPLTYDLVVSRGMDEIESPYGSLLGPSVSSSQCPRIGSAHTQKLIMDYIRKREFDDVRNWPEGAAGLLVWAERAGTAGGLGYGLGGGEMGAGGIEGLWREGFVHCTGMFARLEGGGEWKEISPITRALIERKSLEIQVRVATSDQRLSNFNFTDMWPTTSAACPPARIAFDKFQKFLIKHYTARFGSWPPQTPDGRFSRMLYVQLQRDFAALYDYLVDRDVGWGGSTPVEQTPVNHHRHSPHSIGASSPTNRKLVKLGCPHWRADDEDLQMTDILLAFDDKHNYPHIPHPFPLVPPAMLSPAKLKLGTSSASSAAGRFFQGASRRASIPNTATQHMTTPFIPSSAAEKAAALSLSESTNIESLLSSSVSNSLVDAFAKHEKHLSPSEVDPHDARKGRWLLIYGILQTLATVSVDAPGVKWTAGVDYFLSAKLRGTPPWKRAAPVEFGGAPAADERSHFRSHCWIVPRSWRGAQDSGRGRDDDEMGDLSLSEMGLGDGDQRGAVTNPSPSPTRHRDRGRSIVENKVRWHDAWGTGPQVGDV